MRCAPALAIALVLGHRPMAAAAPLAEDQGWPSAALDVSMRSLAQSVENWLVEWISLVRPATPDLTVLTSSPLAGLQSSGFGWRDDPKTSRRRFHRGTDFRAEYGTPVHAAGDGVVTFAGWQGGYGRVIYLDHGRDVVTRYAHLAAIDVKVGDSISAAARIGQVGASGRTTGPHLHFEVRLEGRAVDPVFAMHVADVQNLWPALGNVFALALGPAIQEHSLDPDDRTNQRRASGERRPSGRRSPALW